jgi:RHS repeat-associated protein
MLLKVMAGDLIKTTAKYFYVLNNSGGGSGTPVDNLATSIMDAIIGPSRGSVLSKGYTNDIKFGLINNLEFQSFINSTQPNSDNTSAPKAYLNIVFLDEQFKFIEPDNNNPGIGTYFKRVSANNDPNAYFSLLQQKAPKNGWVFVYLSNESNEPVYFDDFQVMQEHGRISEENHYYPFGLKIAGISSKAFNKIANTYGFQGNYSEEETETGWDEFDLRAYDPQIGRWTAPDPYDQYPSPYTGMGNNPINRIDPNGGFDFFRDECTGSVVSRPGNTSEFIFIDGQKYKNIGKTLDLYGDFEIIPGIFNPFKMGTLVELPSGKLEYRPGEDLATLYIRYNTASIKKYEPNFWQRRSEGGILSKILYDVADGPYVSFQNFVGKFFDKNMDSYHLNGEISTSDDNISALASNSLYLVPVAGVVEKRAIQEAKTGLTIIGETMERVSVEHAKREGSIILDNMPKFVGTDYEITSKMMTFNRKFMLQRMRSGKPFLDMGRDPNRAIPSIFYEMEQNMMKNYLKLHPDAFKVYH